MLQTIRSKLIFVTCIIFFSVCTLTGLNLWSLSYINKLMVLSERFSDLANNILEVRRFEKNIFLYYDKESVREVISYLEQTDELVEKLSADIIRLSGMKRYSEFRQNLSAYHQNMKRLKLNIGEVARINQEQMRSEGKSMVDFVNELIKIKRNKIHKTIYRISLLPFVFLGIFILVTVLFSIFIPRRLFYPLSMLKKKTREVGSGDFTPISFKDSHNDEISGLIRAFNLMATALETNQENLLQSRKMAALGTFTAGIAHELNNPINNISLTAETFLDEYSEKLDPEGKEMLSDIIAQVERANDIVRNLLDFSRTEESSSSDLDIKDVISSTIKLIKNQIKFSGIKLNIIFSPDLPQIKGNLRSLQQVFLNLLINAHQAMPGGGSIEIKGYSESPGFIRIDIADTGPGIPPEALEKIFEPFYTTKGIGKGVGLGLSVTYSIMKNHGGDIKVTSEVGKGTTFSIFIPSITKAENQ